MKADNLFVKCATSPKYDNNSAVCMNNISSLLAIEEMWGQRAGLAHAWLGQLSQVAD